MAIHSNSEESRILRQLVPLATFPSDAFKELCANLTVEQVQDAAIFKRGDTNTDLVYLLDGSVTLQAEGLVVEVVTSDSESAKFALAHQIPRKIDAVANGVARIVRLDAHTVNNPAPAVYQEDQGYTVIDESFEESDDWMTAVLRLPLFQSLPPANLQKILISLKTSQYSAGDVVIAEGSDVNYFFIIQKGQCLLARKALDEEFELRLSAGDSFGEEYLITGRPAQETITALSDISLIQLEKKHFITQIKTPSIQYVDHEAIPGVPGNGSVLLDVRLPHHFENQNLDGSANIPLMSLRLRLAEIPKDKQIIVVCADGKASEAAAFLLHKNKCNAVVLKDGMGIEEPDDELTSQACPEAQQTIVQGQPYNPSDETMPAASAESINGDLESLRAENAKLMLRNRELEEKNAALQAEKERAENQCQLLTQQLERLKEILGRLTKRQ